MTSNDTVLAFLRSQMSGMKVPQSTDRVFKDECVFSFDSPFSDDGLYVNLISFQGFGKDFLEWDIDTRGGRIYLHEKWVQVPKVTSTAAATGDAADEKPTKLAIGVEGGFITEAQFDIQKEHTLVVFTANDNNSSNNHGALTMTRLALDNPMIPEFVLRVCRGIEEHAGMKSNMQVGSWDADNEKFVSKYAADLIQLNPSGKKVSQDPSQWRDEDPSAATAAGDGESKAQAGLNLWLNLSTGFIGGGRRNWDGSGGSGSSLDHFIATGKKYPLCVKLGTITPHGADVWSYAEDEDALVLDPLLSQHLSFWGIDTMAMRKTEKSLGELEVALNMSYDWTRILDGQQELEKVSGPGFVGLRNIGSSCYMNSLLQSLFAIPEVRERYFTRSKFIVNSAPADPADDFPTQFSKVAVGVLSDRYVPASIPHSAAVDTASAKDSAGAKEVAAMSLTEQAVDESTLEKYVVAPRMFKFLVGKNHAEFSSGRQQDVSEYFQYLLEVIARAEKVHLHRLIDTTTAAVARYTSSLFEFHTQIRYQCGVSGDVKYMKLGQQTLNNMLDLPVPLDKAIPDTTAASVTTAATTATADGKEQESKRARLEGDATSTTAATTAGEDQFIPFAACLESWLQAESVDMFSPSVGQQTTCSKTVRFATFPRYLMVKMSRYFVGSNWVQQKINARIDVPETLDFTALRGAGLQAGEHEMPADNDNNSSNSNSGEGGFVIDEGLVSQLTSMGFSENGCRRAAIATNNADADTAMNWVFAHMEDADFNDPPVMPSTVAATAATTGGGVNQEAVDMLTSIGYSTEQAKAALAMNDSDIERAAEWLLSHADDLEEAVAAAAASTAATATAADQIVDVAEAGSDDGEGKYVLVAIISHIGKNTDHGHYVCHVKKDGHWVLFNDEKVGRSKKAPLEHGFMYLYRRIDGPGTFAA